MQHHNTLIYVIANRLPKSIGAERTFLQNLTSVIFLEEKLNEICDEVSNRLQKRNLAGKTITLKIKYSDFTIQSRSLTLNYYIRNVDLLKETTLNILHHLNLRTSVRLIGVQVSNLNINEKKKVEYIQLKFKF